MKKLQRTRPPAKIDFVFGRSPAPEGSDTSKNRVRDFEITLISSDFTDFKFL